MGPSTLRSRNAAQGNHRKSSEAAVDLALKRTFLQKMKAGLFDSLDGQEWTDFDARMIGSDKHTQISYEAALQGMVLLKNSGHALPLKDGANVAAVGPMAVEGKGLFSDYAQPHAPFLLRTLLTILDNRCKVVKVPS